MVKIKLHDVSPVTFPAYDDTDVAKRQYTEQRGGVTEQDARAIKPKKDSDDKSGDGNELRSNREQMGRRLRLEA